MPRSLSGHALRGLTLAAVLPGAVFASPAAECDLAARQAADTSGVPVEVMLALTRAETGRSTGAGLQPWPWAVNRGGEGHWFDTRAEARDWVQERIDAGETNLDIGCFQLNLRWHAQGFASLDAMFDPGANARYAAEYISEKYQKTGDWAIAAGAYHSATATHAERYATRFAQILAGLDPIRLAAAEPAAARINRFPLLMAGGGGGAGGSLVPLGGAGRALIGGGE